MIVLAIAATVAALLFSFVVVMANGMSSSPSTPFQGGYLLATSWVVCALFWVAWYFR